MTKLEDSLVRQIKLSGPLPIADYMMQCLFHPEHGYYRKPTPFGVQGDFITAPEVSQMFGELTAIWIVDVWQKLGQPKPLNLCELGPGQGTWMDDILRTIAQLSPNCAQAAKVVLIEESGFLRESQKEKLEQHGIPLQWLSGIDNIPDHPSIIIANEFFDAVPIRQYVNKENAWCERMVSLDEKGTLTSVLGAGTVEASTLPIDAHEAGEGAVYEYAPAREALMKGIANHIEKNAGAALIIDYGHLRSGFGDTLQAVQGHRYVDLFHQPGDCDVTSHVDFEALVDAVKSANVMTHPAITQADFLLELGLLERAGNLGSSKHPDMQASIASDVERLAGNGENNMGDLFKVICVSNNLMATPIAFDKT